MVEPGLLRAALSGDDSAGRFERFCIDLYNVAEGVMLVPTSKTWDLGRDARSIALGDGPDLPGVLCASLADEIDAKVRSDIERLRQTTVTTSIVYCSSQPLSEHVTATLERQIRDLYPAANAVRVMGQEQLVALSERHPEPAERHYRAELANLREIFFGEPAERPEITGLRLALSTQTGDDATFLRKEICRRLVLECLVPRSTATAPAIAATISQNLHLPRTLSSAYVEDILRMLAVDDLVENGPNWRVTQVGRDAVAHVPTEAAVRLLEGRGAIKAAIADLSGHELADDHFDRLWKTIQDGLSELFYLHGAAIVGMVANLLAGETTDALNAGRSQLEHLGEQVMVQFADPVQGSEVRQAVVDMFSATGTPAFEWLTQICSVYVMMCSLGFEAVSAQEVNQAIRRVALVADTDLVLSLLCVGESNHAAVERIVRGWRGLGGRLLVALPVLEEAAHHAWIAEQEFRATESLFRGRQVPDADRVLSNAFVRAFQRGAPRHRNWTAYISQFRGRESKDYGHILEILREEYGFGQLTVSLSEHREFAKKVGSFLVGRVARDRRCAVDEVDYRAVDKCHRDGAVMAAVFSARERSRKEGGRETTVVLSSSRLLREADQRFRPEMGRPESVVSPAALGFLMTITPGVQMGLGSLRGVLFDHTLTTRLTPLQRYAYRVIAASSEYDMPWSRRVTLQRTLTERLLADANQQGVPLEQVREQVLKSVEPEIGAGLIRDALEKMAINSSREKELSDLRQEVQQLRAELQSRMADERQLEAAPKKKKASKRRRKAGQ